MLPAVSLTSLSGAPASTRSLSDFDNPVVVVATESVNCTSCSTYVKQVADHWAVQPFPVHPKLVVIDASRRYNSNNALRYANMKSKAEIYFSTNNDLHALFTNFENPLVFVLDKHGQVVFSYNGPAAKAGALYTLGRWVMAGRVTAGAPHFDKEGWPAPPEKAAYYRRLEKQRDGIWRLQDYYMNGTLQMSGRASRLHPEWKSGAFYWYDSAGKKTTEAHYEANRLEGTRKGWHPNGKLYFEETYVAGEKDGPYTDYWPNGNMNTRGQFEAGVRTGKWTFQHPNGKKKTEGTYRRGQLDGVIKSWDEKGNLLMEVTYNGGKLNLLQAPKFLFANGKPQLVQERQGTAYKETYYDAQGRVTMIKQRRDRYDDITEYWPNGKPSVQYTIRFGNLYDKLIAWYENGQKMFEVSLDANKPYGRAMAWWENGQVSEKIDFVKGTYEYFDKGGNAIATPKEKKINITPLRPLDSRSYAIRADVLDYTVKGLMRER